MAAPSFQRILELLDRHRVAYVVVGGVAAVLQGAPITTFDLDTLVKVDERNADRLLAALGELEARSRDHQPAIAPTKKDLLAGGHLLLMTNSGPLDILGFIGDNKTYEDLAAAIKPITVGDLTVPVFELRELIRQKRELGRPKDRAVIDVLEAVLSRRGADPRK